MSNLETPLYPTLQWKVDKNGIRDIYAIGSPRHFCLLIAFSNQNMRDEEFGPLFFALLEADVFREFHKRYSTDVKVSYAQLELPPTPPAGVRLSGTPIVFDDPASLITNSDHRMLGGIGKYLFMREEGVELSEFLFQTPHQPKGH